MSEVVAVPEVPNLQQLRDELAEELGHKPAVHYDPDEGSVVVDSAEPGTRAIVLAHSPDLQRKLPPPRQELLDLIRAKGVGEPVDKDRLDDLLLAFVKEELER